MLHTINDRIALIIAIVLFVVMFTLLARYPWFFV